MIEGREDEVKDIRIPTHGVALDAFLDILSGPKMDVSNQFMEER